MPVACCAFERFQARICISGWSYSVFRLPRYVRWSANCASSIFFFSCCGVGEEGMHRAIVMTVKWTSARIALLGTVHCGLQVRLVS